MKQSGQHTAKLHFQPNQCKLRFPTKTIGLLLLGSGLLLAMNSVANAQSRSVIFGEPLAAPNVPQAGIIPNYSPSPGFGTTVSPTEGYLVYVDGDSELLLAQVQQVEPTAFRRFWNGRSVIQAGFFTGRSNAESRLAALRMQGFAAQLTVTSAQVAAASASPVVASYNSTYNPQPATNYTYPAATNGFNPSIVNTGSTLGGQTVTVYPNTGIGQAGSSGGAGPQLTFTAPQVGSPADTTRYPGYYVVVPGSRDGLPELAAKIQRLGAEPANLFQRQQPRGPHVAMGPFPDRASAEQWNKYLREFGLDARLYFEK